MNLFDETSLFTSGSEDTIRYDLPDASLILYRHFFPKSEADGLYTSLMNNTKWQQDNITLYGKTHLTPRLTAWYGDAGGSYTYSGTRLDPHPWTPELLMIKEKIEQKSPVRFTSVLLNLYRTGQDSVGWHRDNETELGADPIIASVSFGETRMFQIRHKFRKDLERIDIPLHHGSFLLMSGTTQHFWEHQVPKTAKPVSPRINLTFRIIK